MVKPKMFISYRRDDPGNYAGQIYRWARDYFGRESVVIDVEAVEPGEDWLEAITRAVGESRVLLAVIGPQWAALAKSGEGRRDFVEHEVQIALERQGTSVIPVLVGGAEMPEAAQLPANLQRLTTRQAPRLNDHYWDYDIDKLRKALEERDFRKREADRPVAPAPVVPSPQPVPPRPQPDAPSTGALVFQGVLLAFAAGLIANWLVTESMPSPDEQSTEGAAIAVSIARRTVTWSIVGASLALWLALSHGRGRDAPVRALAGLLLGGLAGAIGGTVDALPAITNRELGSWVDPVALGATGALVGALLGGSWRPPHVAYGLAAGAAAGVLAQLAFSPTNPGGGAVRVTLITGLVLIALAGVAMASDAAVRGRPARTDLPPPHAH